MNIIHPQTGKKALSMEDALLALKNARQKYDEVHAEMESVRRAETNALNVLNDAQRAFDAAVGDVRADPPWNSDWHQKTQMHEAVAA